MNMTIRKALAEWTPVKARLLARHGSHLLTNQDISTRSGLSLKQVQTLSLKTSWSDVAVGTALSFLEGCGINPLSARRRREYVRRGHLSHLRRSNKRYIARLLNIIKFQ